MYTDFYGYSIIYINKVYLREHRYVIEQFLNRKLEKNEVVHHLNGIRTDNRIENLQVMDKIKHSQLRNKIIKPRVKKEPRKVCAVTMLEKLEAELRAVADKNNRSMSAQIVTYIQEGIRREK